MRAVAATAAKRLMVALGASAALWATAACGGAESGVVAAEGDSGAAEIAGTETERDAVERIEAVGAETASSQAAAKFDGADAASSASNEAVAGVLSPEEMSGGPILQWTELDLAVDGPGMLVSIGDGRVAIREEMRSGASQLLITSDGSDWSAVQLPATLSPHTFDLTGARWAVAGWSHDDPSDIDFSSRIYISDDQGGSWTEVKLQLDRPDLPEYTVARTWVDAVATSGAQVVALTSTHLDFDVESLLADRGLIPAAAQVHGVSFGGGQVDVWFREESSEADSHGQGPQRPSETALTFTVDELDLSAEQIAIMEDPVSGESIRVHSGSGTELAEVLRLDGWGAGVIGNDDDFVLLTQTDRNEARRLTSSDGENWTAQLLDPSLVPGWPGPTGIAPDGTVWVVSSDGAESHLTRWDADGAALTTTWLGRLNSAGVVSLGPAGLAILALPSPPEPPAGAGSGPPIGRVAKDGYELRYGEPDGGLSLWDVAADEPVYEFGPEVFSSIEPPEGVREFEEGDVFELTFEDPDTGDDLVTFTAEDLAAVFGVQMGSPDSPFADIWVGWSADGADWGWQTVQEAFGLGDVAADVRLAVGEDFVIASVWAYTTVESGSSATGGPDGTDRLTEGSVTWAIDSSASAGPRWFIARVP
ncbi:hypothetical protein [Candidatus Poriferisodalis sp.]|uniref:hypothetical protein n=1 Tax=Candidatus Poriferisodalis sp. TaxID=3101277 RepID=UPI003B01DC41